MAGADLREGRGTVLRARAAGSPLPRALPRVTAWGRLLRDRGGDGEGLLSQAATCRALDPQGLPPTALHLQAHPECVHRPLCPPLALPVSAWVSPMGVPTLGPSHAPRHCILSL